MNETAPQPTDEQLPGQEQLFTEHSIAHGTDPKLVDAYGRFMDPSLGLEGWTPPEPIQPLAASTEFVQVEPTAELPAVPQYESRISRALDYLARRFENKGEKPEKSVEKAGRFGKFLGSISTKREVVVTRINKAKEVRNSLVETYQAGGDTTSARVGNLIMKGLVEKPTRHVSGNVSQLRQENAEARAGYAHTLTEMLGREAAAETDDLQRAKIEHKITKLQVKEVKARSKAQVHAARAHKRRTGSPVRIVHSADSVEPATKAA